VKFAEKFLAKNLLYNFGIN